MRACHLDLQPPVALRTCNKTATPLLCLHGNSSRIRLSANPCPNPSLSLSTFVGTSTCAFGTHIRWHNTLHHQTNGLRSRTLILIHHALRHERCLRPRSPAPDIQPLPPHRPARSQRRTHPWRETIHEHLVQGTVPYPQHAWFVYASSPSYLGHRGVSPTILAHSSFFHLFDEAKGEKIQH